MSARLSPAWKGADPHDVLVLFLAGHGAADEHGEFLFLPKDATLAEGSGRLSNVISWRELKPVLTLPARKLIFVDSCAWEGVGGVKVRAMDNEQLVKDLQEFNAVTYTSCRGAERAMEREAWTNGAFAKALIDGLKSKADLKRDREITLDELDAYVTEAVPLLTNGAQYPVTNTPVGYNNVPIAIVD